MKRYIVLWILIIPIFGCWRKQSDVIGSKQKDSTIVFFNVKQYSRKELADFIIRINQYEPKVIAISLIFSPLRNHHEDSVLAASIAETGKVILSADINKKDLSFDRSEAIFQKSAIDDGVVSYLIEDGGLTTEYIPLYQNDSEQMLSFPDRIVFAYKPSTMEQYGKGIFRVNRTKDISFVRKDTSDFHILKENQFSYETIRNKIVIFGYLESDSKSTYQIPISPGKTAKVFDVVVAANIILNRLSKVE